MLRESLQSPRLPEQTEAAFQRYFAIKRLPWDLLMAVTWLIAGIAHVQLLLEAVAIGCDAGPGWLQSTSVNRMMGNDPERFTSASCSRTPSLTCADAAHDPPAHAPAGTEGTCDSAPLWPAAAAYPCLGSASAKLSFIVHHWQDFSLLATQHPGAKYILWQPYGFSLTLPPVCSLLFCLVASAVVLRHLAATSPPARPLRAPRRRTTTTGTTRTAPSPTKPAAAQAPVDVDPQPYEQQGLVRLTKAAPAWLPAWRAAAIAGSQLSTQLVLLLSYVAYPLPADLVHLSSQHAFSAAAKSNFAIAMAISHVVLMVRAGACSAGGHTGRRTRLWPPCMAPAAAAASHLLTLPP